MLFPVESPKLRTPRRRTAEACIFIGVWVALGFAGIHEPNAYLLLGIPLTVLFQCVIRRQRILTLWVRRLPTSSSVDPRWLIVGFALAVAPTLLMWRAIVSKNALVVLWSASAVVGAFGATFAMRHRTPGLARQAVRCVGTAGALGAAMMFLWAIVTHRAAGRTVHFDMLGGLRWLALYFPACFALEEVAFRGAVDAHLSPDARWNASSAFLSSALWGAWHLPIQVGRGSVVAALIALLVVHLPVGMLLAMGWRRSGNLVPSALAHAVIDAVRNAMVTP